MGQKRDIDGCPMGHSRFDVPLLAGKFVFFSRTWEMGHGPGIVRAAEAHTHKLHACRIRRQQQSQSPEDGRYVTRPPLRNWCVLRAARAAESRFRSGIGTVCAGRCSLGRLFGLAGAARPPPWRAAFAHCMDDKVHVMNSWQSSRKRPVFMLLATCIT